MYKVVMLREYGKCTKTNDPKDCEDWLNEMEKDGWVLVGITNHNYTGYWVFHKDG